MAHKYATKELREQLIREIIALVKSRGRLTTSEAAKHFGIEQETMRRRFLDAGATGEVIRFEKFGLFRNKKTIAEYNISRARRPYGQRRLKIEAMQRNGNGIFDECRQNWQGYRIHKIFGSARA
ncbi:DUF977 family protein [Yokenella regensburgei]|uniref:DUF977 family protein n=1 Tax=Yokenella regensburgei TaxID=158877 RepID=UPI003F17680B